MGDIPPIMVGYTADGESTGSLINLDGYTHLDGSTANGESSVDSANLSEVLQTEFCEALSVDLGQRSCIQYWLY